MSEGSKRKQEEQIFSFFYLWDMKHKKMNKMEIKLISCCRNKNQISLIVFGMNVKIINNSPWLWIWRIDLQCIKFHKDFISQVFSKTCLLLFLSLAPEWTPSDPKRTNDCFTPWKMQENTITKCLGMSLRIVCEKKTHA